MLVLSRKVNEAIMIGDDIKVVVVDIRGDKVRLGIDAPTKVPVHRTEVYRAIHRKSAEAKAAESKEAYRKSLEAKQADAT